MHVQESHSATKRIALILSKSSPVDRAIMRGIAAYIQQHALNWSFHIPDNHPQCIPVILNTNYDGMIVHLEVQDMSGYDINFPMVAIGSTPDETFPNLNSPCYAMDHQMISHMAAKHLLGLGFSRFAYVGWMRRPNHIWSQIRQQMFQKAIEDAGQPCSIFNGRIRRFNQWEPIVAECVQWLDTQPKPLAIMTANDQRATHLLAAAQSLNLRIPYDLAIIGVDNDEMICELANPQLTSIDPGSFDLGWSVAHELQQLLCENGPTNKPRLIPPRRVVARASTDIMMIDESDPDLTAAIKYIHEHAHEAISAEHIVKITSVSRSTLDARFERRFGKSISQQLRYERLMRVKMLLTTSNLPIKQIAQRSGFATVQYLTAAFHQNEKITPAAYRKRYSYKKT